MANNGFFLVLEGGEGCGKTSQIITLVDRLRGLGLTVYPTREPGGTSIGEQIREIIKSEKNQKMSPRTETLLFQAARAQIVEEVIKPKLDEGQVVICDRFFYSTLAYQGYGHRQNLQVLQVLIDYATGGLEPSLVILLDVDPEIGLVRKRNQRGEWDRLESYDLKFHERVREGFLTMAREDPARWRVIDASQTVEKVRKELFETVEKELMARGLLEHEPLGKERR